MSIISEIEEIKAQNKQGWQEINQYYNKLLFNPAVYAGSAVLILCSVIIGGSILTMTSPLKPISVVDKTAQALTNDVRDTLEIAFIVLCMVAGGAALPLVLAVIKRPDYHKVEESDRRLRALVMSPRTNHLSAQELEVLQEARKEVKGTRKKSEFV